MAKKVSYDSLKKMRIKIAKKCFISQFDKSESYIGQKGVRWHFEKVEVILAKKCNMTVWKSESYIGQKGVILQFEKSESYIGQKCVIWQF